MRKIWRAISEMYWSELIMVGLLFVALLLMFNAIFDVHVEKNQNKYYDYTTTKIEHYTKYDASCTTTVYNLQTESGKKLTMKDIEIERQTDLPDKKHKLGSTTVVLRELKVKKKFPGIVRFILKPANVNATFFDYAIRPNIKPTLVITKYKYDD